MWEGRMEEEVGEGSRMEEEVGGARNWGRDACRMGMDRRCGGNYGGGKERGV